MKFSENTIKDFVRDLQSDLPAPGGGSAAGLVAAVAAALNSMVYSLTVTKKKFLALDLETQKKILDFKEQSEKFSIRSFELMEQDRKNFLKLMDCFKLPKETEEDKTKRKQQIRICTIKSMDAPLALIRECAKMYENLELMTEYGNTGVLSDLEISAVLLNAVIESSAVNVKINLKSLKEETFYEKYLKETEEILEFSKRKKEEIVDKIEKKLY